MGTRAEILHMSYHKNTISTILCMSAWPIVPKITHNPTSISKSDTASGGYKRAKPNATPTSLYCRMFSLWYLYRRYLWHAYLFYIGCIIKGLVQFANKTIIVSVWLWRLPRANFRLMIGCSLIIVNWLVRFLWNQWQSWYNCYIIVGTLQYCFLYI